MHTIRVYHKAGGLAAMFRGPDAELELRMAYGFDCDFDKSILILR